jgi:hypothetical protein
MKQLQAVQRLRASLPIQAIVKHRPLLDESMFDEGVVGYLKRLSEEEGLDVFEELINADLSSVRPIL